MKDEIKYIHSTINELQRFAEAKHAGLIVLNSAIIIGIISSSSNIAFLDRNSTLITLALLGISIFGSLVAQFPIVSNLLSQTEDTSNPNLYYFGDLSKIKEDDFIEEFKKSFPKFVSTQSDHNLINQILVNARITDSKFKIFKFCCAISMLGIGILGFSSIIKILWL